MEEFVDAVVKNPNCFALEFDKFGHIKSKNFKEHLVPEFFQEHIRNLMFAMFIYKQFPTRIIKLFISKVMTKLKRSVQCNGIAAIQSAVPTM